jgi:uncharacterized surface protein with fasciclin (FAS1) repeats
MATARYLLIATILVAAIIIAAAPKGSSVLEVTAMLNNVGTTKGEVDTFLALASHSSLALEKVGRNTLIVPADTAFDAYFEARGTDLETVLADSAEVDRIVGSHVIRGSRDSTRMEQPAKLRTIAGTTIEVSEGRLISGDAEARIIRPDANAANGIVHVISGVLA